MYRDTSQDVCPWNVRFARELREPAFAPREVLAEKDPRSLARELLAMSQPEFSTAFQGSPMKRAKLRGLKRNAAVMIGNAGDPSEIPALTAALSDDEPLVRTHVAWALGQIGSVTAAGALLSRVAEESDPRVLAAVRSALDRFDV